MSSTLTPVTYNQEKFTTKSGDKATNIMDTFILDGEYAIKIEYVNEETANAEVHTFEEVENCKAIYTCGNILYKSKEPKIWEYIDLIIKATYKKELSVSVDRSVRDRVQKIGGTICPTQDTIFAYEGKLFVLYGRYIYGYDQPYVRFVNENAKNAVQETEVDTDQSDYESEESDCDEYGVKDLPASLSNKEIILPTLPYKKKYNFVNYLHDYNYSFAIIEAVTGVLLAFGLYR